MIKKSLEFNKPTIQPRGDKTPRRMVFYPADISDGCTQFRFEWPRQTLNTERMAEIQLTNVIQDVIIHRPNGENFINPVYTLSDTVVLQRPVIPKYLQFAKQIRFAQNEINKKGNVPFRFIIDVDDVVHGDDIADFNVAKVGYANNERFDTFRRVVDLSDELHVASPYMQKYYRDVLDFERVTYRPNFLPKYLFEGFYDERIIRERYEKHQNKPRIVWAGSWTHIDIGDKNKGVDDFSKIKKFIKDTKDKFQWVFYGAHPLGFESYIKDGTFEYIPWSSIMQYPQKLWDLEPTIFLAPLDNNMFNRCKSNIKLTEMGAMGIAGIYQNIEPYDEAPLKFDTVEEIEGHIEFLLEDWENYAKVIRGMRKHSEQFFMEDPENMKYLMASYLVPYGNKRRGAISPKLEEWQHKE